MPALQQFPVARLRLVGLSLEESTKWWCAICGEKYDWKQPHRLIQTCDSVEQAKVCKVHAVPQGLCALKLLANQDGDGLLQNVVKNLGKESRRGLTDGPALRLTMRGAPWMLEGLGNT